MRILHIDNIMIRRYGNTKVATGRKLFNGLIRNNHKVLEFSDRDIAHFEAPSTSSRSASVARTKG